MAPPFHVLTKETRVGGSSTCDQNHQHEANQQDKPILEVPKVKNRASPIYRLVLEMQKKAKKRSGAAWIQE